MKKWFFRFLKLGFLLTFLVVGGSIALYHWASPDPKEIALVPMTVDPATMKGVGFMTNATGEPWVVYVSSLNRNTSEIKVTRVWLTVDRLQGVSYDTPPIGEDEVVDFRIMYATRLAQNSTSSSPDGLQPSSRPSPAR